LNRKLQSKVNLTLMKPGLSRSDRYRILTCWNKKKFLMLISEFWEDHFKCQYPNAPRTPYNVNYTRNCTTKERLTKQNTAFEDQLQFVSDAVMAFAYAFR